MKQSTLRNMVALTLVCGLSACGGGSSGGSTLPIVTSPGSTPTSQTQKVALSISIPAAAPSTASSERRPQFVSSATNGAVLSLTQGGPTTQTVVDLSSSSPDCTTGDSGRSCRVNLILVPGSATVGITTYDQAPVSGAIPATAHELGAGSVTQTITSAAGQQIDLFVGGLISSIAAQPAFASIAGDGTAHVFGFVLDPVDFDDTPITAGTNDPYANPINVSLTESGGDDSSHAHLLVSGSDVGSSTTLTQSSQTLALAYDGGSAPGYSATVTLAVAGVGTYHVQISPMFVAQGQTVARRIDLTGSAASPSYTVSEANAPVNPGYSLGTSEGCTGIASVSALVSGGVSSATFNATGGSTASASGCAITVADSSGTSVTVPVTNTLVAGSVTIGGVAICEYSVGGSPGQIVVGPDTNLWVAEPSGLLVFSTGGSTQNFFPISGAQLVDLTVGSDGAVWATDQGLEGVDRVTTAGVVAQYPTSIYPQGITTGSDGTMWVTDSNGNLWNLNVGGQYTFAVSFDGEPTNIVQGPDGALWWVNDTEIARFNPADASFAQIAVPDEEAASDLAVGPDGAIWFTVDGSSPLIGRIAMSGDGPFTVDQFALGEGANPGGIVGGVDDAVWYTDTGSSGSIGRISTVGSNAMSSYAVPDAGAPAYITLGPDGSLWFTDTTGGYIGHVKP